MPYSTVSSLGTPTTPLSVVFPFGPFHLNTQQSLFHDMIQAWCYRAAYWLCTPSFNLYSRGMMELTVSVTANFQHVMHERLLSSHGHLLGTSVYLPDSWPHCTSVPSLGTGPPKSFKKRFMKPLNIGWRGSGVGGCQPDTCPCIPTDGTCYVFTPEVVA